MKAISIATFAAFAMLFLIACSAPIPVKPATEAPKPEKAAVATDATASEALMEEWLKMAEEDYEDYDYNRAIEIANKMVELNPEGLEVFFNMIKDPSVTPKAKMLAVVSLAHHIKDTHVARLMPLTEPEYDQATRGCALHLLSYTYNADALFRIRDLMHDADSHVSKVAILAMLRKGDPEALAPALAIWDNPETLDRDRNEIVLAIPDMMVVSNQRIFREALRNEEIEGIARSRAIKILGIVGTAEAIPDLQACLGRETDPAMRDKIEEAIAAIQKRDEEGITAVPLQLPEDMNIVFHPHETEAPDADPVSEPAGDEETQVTDSADSDTTP